MRLSLPLIVLSLVASLGACKAVHPHPGTDAAVVPDARPDGSGDAGCQEGANQCAANILQHCTNGHWEDFRVCEDTCDPVEGCREVQPDTLSFIWIANTAEGTVSKIDTRTMVEAGRYRTCADGYCDPSRTSVNLHADAVVTNRSATPSAVTKFAANVNECMDRNQNGAIDTSTGANDVKAFGEDECMLWHTPLPDLGMFGGYGHGARATAWDGKEDPYTGEGGHVYVGTCGGNGSGNVVFVLNGDTGEVDSHVIIPELGCSYGGAMDPQGNFWIFNSGSMSLVKVEAESLFWEVIPITCAYGITVDGQGRVWTGGYGSMGGYSTCVSRYDPSTGIEDVIGIPGGEFLRGIAVGTAKSEGYVWASDSPGTLYQIDQDSMEVVGSYVMGSGIDMIGAAVDFQGYVWTVAQMSSSAYKFDPDVGTFATFSALQGPYTYSDMTGVQLRNVVPVD